MKIRGIWVINTETGERVPVERDDERLRQKINDVIQPIIIRKLQTGVMVRATE